MTLTDAEDVKAWYAAKIKSEWEVEMTNLVLNKNENDEEVNRTFDLLMLLEENIQLTPDLFINTSEKEAWKELYPYEFEGNLSKIMDFLQEKGKITQKQPVFPELSEAA